MFQQPRRCCNVLRKIFNEKLPLKLKSVVWDLDGRIRACICEKKWSLELETKLCYLGFLEIRHYQDSVSKSVVKEKSI